MSMEKDSIGLIFELFTTAWNKKKKNFLPQNLLDFIYLFLRFLK